MLLPEVVNQMITKNITRFGQYLPPTLTEELLWSFNEIEITVLRFYTRYGNARMTHEHNVLLGLLDLGLVTLT